MEIVNISKFVFSVIFFSSLHHNSLAQNDDGSSKKNEERHARKTEFGVTAGTSVTGLIFQSSGPEEIVENDYGQSLNATVGFFVMLVGDPKNGRSATT